MGVAAGQLTSIARSPEQIPKGVESSDHIDGARP